jgi:hypothetical protein
VRIPDYPTLAAAISLALSACGPSQEDLANGDDPVAALASTVESSRYGSKFWTEQMTSTTDVWTAALAYCDPAERADYPNCKTVRSVKFIGVPAAVGNPARSEKGFNP